MARHYLSACRITFPAATCSPASEVQVVRFLWIYPENVSAAGCAVFWRCLSSRGTVTGAHCDIKGTDEYRSRCCLDLLLRERIRRLDSEANTLQTRTLVYLAKTDGTLLAVTQQQNVSPRRIWAYSARPLNINDTGLKFTQAWFISERTVRSMWALRDMYL